MVKARTNPNRASASVKAMPRNIVVRATPAASGWRDIAVMALPTTRPIPMPGPMAAPPYTMPRPTAVRPFWSSPGSWAANINRWCTNTPPSALFGSLMLWVHCAADVHGGQDREDERLQDGDENLEAVEGDQQRARDQGADDGGGEQGGGEYREGRQQQVAGQQVGEEPDGERQGPREEEGQELDGRHQDVQRLGHARREQHALEVAAESLMPQADDVVQEEHDHRHEERQRHARCHRHLDDGDDLEDVADEDEGEQRQQERRPAQALGPHRLQDDVVADEVDDGLGEVLRPARYERTLAGEEEERHDDDRRQPHQQHDLVHGPYAATEDRRPLDEVADRREVEAQKHAGLVLLLFRLETRIGEGRGHVLGLPEQEPELGQQQRDVQGRQAAK